MTKDEALRLALEAMEEIIHWYAVRDRNDVFLNFVDQNPEIQKTMKSITAIKEALETKDEPVAWCDPKEIWQLKNGRGYFIVMPEKNHVYSKPLYTTPQREWVGLMDEEIEQIYMETMNFQQNARALEAKLKDKNVR